MRPDGAMFQRQCVGMSRPGLAAAVAQGAVANGEARGLLVVPRWFLTKFPIYGTAPQHKLSRVKPPRYAARQLTTELPTSSDKVWRSEKY